MDTAYRPRDPKAKLQEIVTRHLGVLRTMRLTPNCDVSFVGADGRVGDTAVRGWLLRDPQATVPRRYLLLDDGDVWREAEQPAADGEQGERVWLNGPDDDFVALLARSQASARMERNGLLEEETRVLLDPHLVSDRRTEARCHGGPERRSAR
jgi:hypothetical protein